MLSTNHVELSSASAPPPAGPSAETNDDLLNTVSQSIIRNATGLQPQIVEPKLDKETEIIPNSERRSLHKDARAAMVKVEHGIKSLPIGLAIVQEVERRFGKLRDFKLLPVCFTFAFADHSTLLMILPVNRIKMHLATTSHTFSLNSKIFTHYNVLMNLAIKRSRSPWNHGIVNRWLMAECPYLMYKTI